VLLRTIAFFEALKGLLALGALLLVLKLMHHDLQAVVMHWITRFDLDPQAHLASVMLHYAEVLPETNVQSLIALALGYVALRFVEAFGLWRDAGWAEWLGAASGGIYVPFEIEHLIDKPGLITAGVIALNLFIVAYLLRHLWLRRHPHD